nr:protein kinase [Prochloraceae cyanobacterium]
MTKMVGKSLQNGQYILEGELGQGGFGITYKATDTTRELKVVIKTLNCRLQKHSNPSKLHFEFENEAKRLSKFSHPNIVAYKDFFVENGLPYIVMEYVQGVSLDRLIKDNQPLSETTAINYIRQIGEALKVIHQNGLLHRDIKPQNIILRQGTQQVVLIDFGIAREFSQGVTKTHTNLITNGYAPIEQYFPKAKRSAAIDVYGLAATLYTLLTSEIPLAATLRSHLPLTSPKELVPQLSNRISDAVMSGMALEPEDRPSSVSEWLRQLELSQREFITTPELSLSDGTNILDLTKQAKKKNQAAFVQTLIPPTRILAGAIALLGLGLAMASTRFSTPTPQIPLSKINKSSPPTTKLSKQQNPETIELSSEIKIQPISKSAEKQIETIRQRAQEQIETIREQAREQIETIREQAREQIETIREQAREQIETI